ncbi:MAG: hypothetical protein U0800_06985 [Isosphaeraceae bacterium]
MNQGKIEAVGTDAELRRTSALYRRLHEIHFQQRQAPSAATSDRTAMIPPPEYRPDGVRP